MRYLSWSGTPGGKKGVRRNAGAVAGPGDGRRRRTGAGGEDEEAAYRADGSGRGSAAKRHGGQTAARGIMGMRSLSPATSGTTGGFLGPGMALRTGSPATCRVSRTTGSAARHSGPGTRATLP
ncbi:hypothetical protein GCM10010424_18500 [Streptomyces lienomycini]